MLSRGAGLGDFGEGEYFGFGVPCFGINADGVRIGVGLIENGVVEGTLTVEGTGGADPEGFTESEGDGTPTVEGPKPIGEESEVLTGDGVSVGATLGDETGLGDTETGVEGEIEDWPQVNQALLLMG